MYMNICMYNLSNTMDNTTTPENIKFKIFYLLYFLFCSLDT